MHILYSTCSYRRRVSAPGSRGWEEGWGLDGLRCSARRSQSGFAARTIHNAHTRYILDHSFRRGARLSPTEIFRSSLILPVSRVASGIAGRALHCPAPCLMSSAAGLACVQDLADHPRPPFDGDMVGENRGEVAARSASLPNTTTTTPTPTPTPTPTAALVKTSVPAGPPAFPLRRSSSGANASGARLVRRVTTQERLDNILEVRVQWSRRIAYHFVSSCPSCYP